MTPGTAESGVLETRYVPWLARFRRTGRSDAKLRLERTDGVTADPRASTAARNGLQVAVRGLLFERAELARELALGSIPETDAELALHAYLSWGRGGIRRLRGIFALFIWDDERDYLLAARDHLGAEPLFYARAGEEMLFAASPSILLAQPRVPRAPNPTVLVEAIYWHWPVPEETALQSIYRVPPGHVLTVTNGSATSDRFWNPFDDLQERGWVELDELAEFDHLLERAVSQCLDLGPGGIFLSGGLDSVSIAAVAGDLAESRGSSAPLALSLVFPTPETTEEEVQAGVARALRLPQIMLGLEESVAPDGLLRRALDLSADWPLPRTYLWSGAYLELARAGANKGARVIMTGGGGDEWLTVDLKLAADFIEARQFRSLYRFTRSKIDSFSVPAWSTLRYVLWEYGLREVLRFHARSLLDKYAPAIVQARRRRILARAALPWVAPDPAIRADVQARRQNESGRRWSSGRPAAAFGSTDPTVALFSTTRNSRPRGRTTTNLEGASGSSTSTRTGSRIFSRFSTASLPNCSCRAASRRVSYGAPSHAAFRASASSVNGRSSRPTTTTRSFDGTVLLHYADSEAAGRLPRSESSTVAKSTPSSPAHSRARTTESCTEHGSCWGSRHGCEGLSRRSARE